MRDGPRVLYGDEITIALLNPLYMSHVRQV